MDNVVGLPKKKKRNTRVIRRVRNIEIALVMIATIMDEVLADDEELKGKLDDVMGAFISCAKSDGHNIIDTLTKIGLINEQGKMQE